MVDVEAGLGHLGRPGRFHVIVFLCLGLNNLVVVLNHLAMVVYAPKTPFKCHVSDEWLNKTIVEDLVVTPGECSVHVNSSVNGSWYGREEPCPGQWDYFVPDREYNIIMQVGAQGS
jgi:hypothetical protein